MTSSVVTLVDADDNAIGEMDKLAAHEAPGYLHRAFSIMIMDDDGRVLLHRRAPSKYHFGGRWTNTCCSHPGPGEDLLMAARQRLNYEMGLDSTDLSEIGSFEYRAVDLDSGLIEHELDHVIVGTTADLPAPNPAEASDTRWVPIDELGRDLAACPEQYSPWLEHVVATIMGSRCLGGEP